MNLIGKTIANRYEIIEKTGMGGMATVYRAKDLVLNRDVAVKVLKEEFTTDEEFVKRFNTEAQAAASLSHPNIVSIYDVGNEENTYYIVMELIRGKTLKQIITEEGKLPWKWSVNIAIQIASALEMAHKHNIVHRDIKPHNIIITEDGIAKVTDFGIAKAVSNSTITAFGTTIGSVHYFSPEQAKGGYTDAKSDIYSLGVVMYEMLTGRVPFDADTSVSVALKHMQEEPIPPDEVNEDIPKAVNDIILKAMQKEPSARYQTASEMVKDLSKSLKDPDGDFVSEEEENDGMTRRMDAVTDDMLDNNKRTKTKKKKGLAKLFDEHPGAKVPVILLIIVVLFAVSLGITLLVLNKSTPKEVQIPNLVGMTPEEAQKKLSEINVKYNKVNDEYSTVTEVGKISSQDPVYLDNFKIKEGSTINVMISLGTETTTVPKVVGKTYDEAVETLTNAKLTAEKIEEASDTVKAGIVISQEIAANTTANAGDTVKIHVSTGIEQVKIPSVIGQTEESARTTLAALGLVVKVEYSADSSKNAGVVLSQNQAENSSVDKGSTITLTVNNYKETKEIAVIVNVAKLINETTNTNTTNTTTSTSSGTVKITVNDEVRTGVNKTETAYKGIKLSGSAGDSVTITITINDSSTGEQLYKSSKTATYGTSESVTFE